MEILEEIRVITGIIAGVLALFEMTAFIARRIKKVNLRLLRGKTHMRVGIAMIILAVIHGIIAVITALSEGLTLAMVVTLITGFLSLGLCIGILFTYRGRKKHKKWLAVHLVFSIIMVVVTVIHIVFNGIVA